MTRKNIETLWMLFLVMCILGWVYETVLEVVVYQWGFSNRGALFGPWLPVYGVGGLLFTGSCFPIMESKIKTIWKVVWVFLITMVVATAVELIASYILEAATGGWLWDYTRYAINFQGRIALSTSIRFGLCGILGMFAVVPLVKKACNAMRDKMLDMLTTVTAALFIADVVFSAAV